MIFSNIKRVWLGGLTLITLFLLFYKRCSAYTGHPYRQMLKLLVLIVNNFLVMAFIQSQAWAEVYDHLYNTPVPWIQTLPAVIKSGLTTTLYFITEVELCVRRWFFYPLIANIIFTLVKIAYYVCWESGFYHYEPVFIKQKALLFQAYNAYEALTYRIVRDFATYKLSARYVITSLCIIFILRVTNFPIILSITAYYYVSYGKIQFLCHIDSITEYRYLVEQFRFKKLTFQRWEIIYNGGRSGLSAEQQLLYLRKLSETNGQKVFFYLTQWKDGGGPHFTNTHMRERGDWDPSLPKGHSLAHTSNLIKSTKVASTVPGLTLPQAKNPGFYLPSTKLVWVNPSKYKTANSFDLWINFYTYYENSDDFHTLLYDKWSFPATADLKYQNDLHFKSVESLFDNEGIAKSDVGTTWSKIVSAGHF